MSAKLKNKEDAYCAAANKAGSKIRALYQAASNEVHDRAESIEDQIHNKPVKAGLIALGVGLVLGALLGRRS